MYKFRVHTLEKEEIQLSWRSWATKKLCSSHTCTHMHKESSKFSNYRERAELAHTPFHAWGGLVNASGDISLIGVHL